MKRAESEPDWVPHDPVTIGTAEPGHAHSEYPAAVLWVPDPEQRHGWREVYVSRAVAKSDKPFGFRKR